MLHVYHPDTYLPERRYIFEILLREFLGLDYESHTDARHDVCITDSSNQAEPGAKSLILADDLFATAASDWLTAASMPRQPLMVWDTHQSQMAFPLLEAPLPILYGTQEPDRSPLSITASKIGLSLDIFGSAFFCLTRYEEIVSTLTDRYGRFPITASLAWQESFVERPLVNEYLEVLWALLSRLWPRLERKAWQHRVILSCDVDWPYCAAGQTTLKVLRSSAVDVAIRHEPRLALRRMRSHITAQRTNDPCNTFEWIVDLSEHYGFRHAFNFIPAHSGGAIDGIYSLDDPWVRGLLRFLWSRQHEIGLHTSFGTFIDAEQTRLEKEKLTEVMAQEHIMQQLIGGRQHYLRWKNPVTWQNWEDAGLTYDSTLTFAEQVGFRCGTCYEYPVFNLKTRQQLALRERPLIVMEGSLFDYMKMPIMSAIAKIQAQNAICKRFNGNFTLLWHNSTLISRQQQAAYEATLKVLAS